MVLISAIPDTPPATETLKGGNKSIFFFLKIWIDLTYIWHTLYNLYLYT